MDEHDRGMTIREYVAYRKAKGWNGSVGGVHYWVKKLAEVGEPITNDFGLIDVEGADNAIPGPASKLFTDSMKIREYVEHRRKRGLPGSSRSVWERIRLGYIVRYADGYIRAAQADYIWDYYRCGLRCPGHLIGRWHDELQWEAASRMRNRALEKQS